MDVRFSEEQQLLRRSAREVLERECPMRLVRAQLEEPQADVAGLWKQVAELGWAGLALPSAHGGAGLGLLELVVLLEEMGRCLFPGPFLSSQQAALAIALAGSPVQQRHWLPALAAGTQRGTLACLEQRGGAEATEIRLAARRTGNGFALTGSKHFVLDARAADLFVVPARTAAQALTLFVVGRTTPGLTLHPVPLVDATRPFAELRFEDVVVGPDDVLGAVDGGAPRLEQVLDRTRVALCAELCGIAERVLELSLAYARSREQFGRPIGSFQAIQHKCADMLVALESARSATYYAAWALDADAPDAHLAACMAKACCSDACPEVAARGIQIHGGLGFTWEQDLHLYYKRAQANALLYGDAAASRREVARLLLDEQPA